MREILIIAGQAVALGIVVVALLSVLIVAVASEPGRTLLLNIATAIAIWWIITALQELRDLGRTCSLCQRLNRIRCPVCNTPHQQGT